jgi:hypothetical protein
MKSFFQMALVSLIMLSSCQTEQVELNFSQDEKSDRI